MLAAFAKAVADGVTSFEQLRIAELRYLAELNSVQLVGVPTAANLAKRLYVQLGLNAGLKALPLQVDDRQLVLFYLGIVVA
jgi:hypothetical protein